MTSHVWHMFSIDTFIILWDQPVGFTQMWVGACLYIKSFFLKEKLREKYIGGVN